MRSRRVLSAWAAVLVLTSACATGAPPADSSAGTDRSGGAATGRDTSAVTGPSALEDPRNEAFPEPLIDPDDVLSGGPPPDGIPPIDDPSFIPASDVTWLADGDPVLSLTVGEETRAYPLEVMTWHEIVNDEVDGTPVTVTYCPLCNSGVAFEREVDGRVLDFGTSGMLYVDNLVMYDRQTESLWPQLTGQASIGQLTGTQLEAIPMGVVGWDQFAQANPESLVLTRNTGFVRDYGRNPYTGYDDPDGDLLVEPPDPTDGRLPVKERVVGVKIGDEAVAVRRERVVRDGVVPLTVDGRDVVVWHRPGQASALDTGTIADGREIGSVGVFDPEADGRALTFDVDDGRIVDEQTGSRWSILGEATSGPLRGSTLPPVTHLDTFWFAWVGFRPATRVVQ